MLGLAAGRRKSTPVELPTGPLDAWAETMEMTHTTQLKTWQSEFQLVSAKSDKPEKQQKHVTQLLGCPEELALAEAGGAEGRSRKAAPRNFTWT